MKAVWNVREGQFGWVIGGGEIWGGRGGGAVVDAHIILQKTFQKDIAHHVTVID